MPIYLVQWPGDRASLVRAQNQAHLCDILDEVVDPGIARWAVYRGPLWIDFDLPTTTRVDEDGETVHSADVAAIVAEVVDGDGEVELEAQVGPNASETAGEMCKAVTAGAWPHLHAVVEEWHTHRDGGEAEEGDVEAWQPRFAEALAADAEAVSKLRASRRAAVASLDPQAQAIMQMVGVSIEPTWVPGWKKSR
jgi:hypothetical protein